MSTASRTKDGTSRARRRTTDVHPGLVLGILSAASFLAALNVWITNVGLPAIGRGVDASSLSDLSWVLNGYTIVYAALLVPGGRIADRLGRKSLFLVGLAVFGLGSLGAGLSDSTWILVGFRVVQASGAALLTPASLGLVLAIAPTGKTRAFVKIWFTTSALAAAIGPVTGGLLIEVSWRLVFFVNIPVIVAALVLATRYVPGGRSNRAAPVPDLLGGLLLVVGIGAVAFGLVKSADYGWGSVTILSALAVAVAALVAFVARSRTHVAPIVQLDLFRSRVFTSAILTTVMIAASFSIVLLSVILWLQGRWDFSAIRTGLATAPIPVMFATFAFVAERVLMRTRVGPALVATAGVAVAAGGIVLMSVLLTAEPDYLHDLLGPLLLVGAGFGSALPIAVSSATADLPAQDSATGSAVVSMSQQIGTVVGVSILVVLLGAASSSATVAQFRHAWTAAIVIAALGAVAGLRLRATTPQPLVDGAGRVGGPRSGRRAR